MKLFNYQLKIYNKNLYFYVETVIFESLLIAFPPGQQLSNKSLALSIDSEMIFYTAKAIKIFLSLSTSANLSKNFV